MIIGVIAGVPVPFPVPVPDACKANVKCPIGQGDTNLATLSIPVEKSYPSISLYVKIELNADDQKEDYVCLEFPAAISNGPSRRSETGRLEKRQIIRKASLKRKKRSFALLL